MMQPRTFSLGQAAIVVLCGKPVCCCYVFLQWWKVRGAV